MSFFLRTHCQEVQGLAGCKGWEQGGPKRGDSAPEALMLDNYRMTTSLFTQEAKAFKGSCQSQAVS